MPGFFSVSDLNKDQAKVTALPQCGKCGLYKKCTSPKMKPTGKGSRRILFVAEAPGEQEDRQGIQLIGDAGQRLRKSLRQVGMDLEEGWKTNSVICRPPKNKIEPYMISCCRPHLLKTIKELKPRVIVTLGTSALSSLLYNEWKKNIGPLGRWVGWRIPSRQYGAWLCPTYHPSYLLRMGEDKTLVRIFEEHLRQALALERRKPEYEVLSELEREVDIIHNPRAAYKRMKDLALKNGVLAFDYETTGLKPDRECQRLYSCAFSLDGEDTFAFKLHDKHLPVFKRILQKKSLKKVASNIKFEERWSIAKAGCRVAGWHWDTMLMAHILDNRKQICSIKFQAFVRLGVPTWDELVTRFLYSKHANMINNIDKAPLDELLLYNGLDSLLEYKVMRKQKEEFYGRV